MAFHATGARTSAEKSLVRVEAADIPISLCLCSEEFDCPQDAGRQRLQVFHVLRDKALPVLEVEETIVRQRLPGQLVDRKVGDSHFQMVVAFMKLRGDVENIWRMPYRTGSLAVHEDDSRFPDWAFQQRACAMLSGSCFDRDSFAEVQADVIPFQLSRSKIEVLRVDRFA